MANVTGQGGAFVGGAAGGVDPANIGTTEFQLADYAALQGASTLEYSLGDQTYITDASGDPGVTSGWAIYRWNGAAHVRLMSEEDFNAIQGQNILTSDITADANHFQNFDGFNQTWNNISGLDVNASGTVDFTVSNPLLPGASGSLNIGISSVTMTGDAAAPNGILGIIKADGNRAELSGTTGGIGGSVEFAVDNASEASILGEAQLFMKTNAVTKATVSAGDVLTVVEPLTGEVEFASIGLDPESYIEIGHLNSLDFAAAPTAGNYVATILAAASKPGLPTDTDGFTLPLALDYTLNYIGIDASLDDGTRIITGNDSTAGGTHYSWVQARVGGVWADPIRTNANTFENFVNADLIGDGSSRLHQLGAGDLNIQSNTLGLLSTGGSGIALTSIGGQYLIGGGGAANLPPISGDGTELPLVLQTDGLLRRGSSQQSQQVGWANIGDILSPGPVPFSSMFSAVNGVNVGVTATVWNFTLAVPFANSDWNLQITLEELVNNSITGNDFTPPVVFNKNASSFQLFLEETSGAGQTLRAHVLGNNVV